MSSHKSPNDHQQEISQENQDEEMNVAESSPVVTESLIEKLYAGMDEEKQ